MTDSTSDLTVLSSFASSGLVLGDSSLDSSSLTVASRRSIFALIARNGSVRDRTWAKLREALPALRRARIQGDAPTVRAILDDVKRIKTREAARRKYRRSRVKLGQGMTIQTAEGQIILVVVLDNPLAEDRLADRLGHAIELNGHKNGFKRQAVGILAAAIQALNA